MTLYSKISKKEYENLVTICDYVIDTIPLIVAEKKPAIEEALTTLFTIIGDYEDINCELK